MRLQWDAPDSLEAAYACDDGDAVVEAAGTGLGGKVVLDLLEAGEGALLLLLDGAAVWTGHRGLYEQLWV